jgi:hypothetical protein
LLTILQEFRKFWIFGENPKLRMKIAKPPDTGCVRWSSPIYRIFIRYTGLLAKLMLAQEDVNCTYLNQLYARYLLVVSFSRISEQLLYSPWHFQTTATMQYFQMHLLA